MASAGTLRWHDIVSGAATTAAVAATLNPEIVLQEDWNQETYDLYGIRCKYYILIYNANKDIIMGEDSLKSWASAGQQIDLQFEIEPEVDAWGSFGPIAEEMTVARASLRSLGSLTYTSGSSAVLTGHVPQIGDLVKVEYNNLLFEVIDVGEDRETMGTFNFLNYKYILKRFIYSGEDSTNLPSDNIPSTSACATSGAIETESDTIVDYDDDTTLDDDIYGQY